MNVLTALKVLKDYPPESVVSDIYDADKDFSAALLTLFPHSFEYPEFSGRKVANIIKSIEKLNKACEASLAVEHQRSHMALKQYRGCSDSPTQSAAAKQIDMVSIALAQHGWSNQELSANASGMSLQRFREAVVQGIYDAGYGVPESLRGRPPGDRTIASLQKATAVSTAGALNSKYAESIIKGNRALYHALEVHGVRELNSPEHEQRSPCEIDDVTPQFFSVYVRGAGNGATSEFSGIDAVGDFAEHSDALAYANELSRQYHYPVQDFTRHGNAVQRDMAQSKSCAEEIASEKARFWHLDLAVNQTRHASVMGTTDHHVVVSVGRNAMIFEKRLLESGQRLQAGQNVSIQVDAGKARIAAENAKGIGIER